MVGLAGAVGAGQSYPSEDHDDTHHNSIITITTEHLVLEKTARAKVDLIFDYRFLS